MLTLFQLEPRIKPNKPRKAGWKNHPAGLMWKGHEGALWNYWVAINREWKRRGYNSEATDLNIRYIYNKRKAALTKTAKKPKWFGDEKFHASHRSKLLSKDKKYYNQFGWKEKANLDYIWPVTIAALKAL